MEQNSKVAVVTGAAGGIGRATALRFASEGYLLAISDINQEGLRKLDSELAAIYSIHESYGSDPKCLILPGDLTCLTEAKSLIDQAVEAWGRIDVLVNNAIWRKHGTMRTIDIESWDKMITVGLTAPAFLSKWSAEVMEKNGIGGTIVNVSSITATRTGGTGPAYAAVKGGLESLTYDLASLYGPSGIRVVAVAPGNVNTELSNDFVDADGQNISQIMVENMEDQTPLRRSAQPDEIANAIFWLCSGQASYVSGTVLKVDGGFTQGFNHYSKKRLQFPGEF